MDIITQIDCTNPATNSNFQLEKFNSLPNLYKVDLKVFFFFTLSNNHLTLHSEFY